MYFDKYKLFYIYHNLSLKKTKTKQNIKDTIRDDVISQGLCTHII